MKLKEIVDKRKKIWKEMEEMRRNFEKEKQQGWCKKR